MLVIDRYGGNGWALCLLHRLSECSRTQAHTQGPLTAERRVANSSQLFPELKEQVVTSGQESVSCHTSLSVQSRKSGPSPGLAVAWTFPICLSLLSPFQSSWPSFRKCTDPGFYSCLAFLSRPTPTSVIGESNFIVEAIAETVSSFSCSLMV